jgi:hypothetical protein
MGCPSQLMHVADTLVSTLVGKHSCTMFAPYWGGGHRVPLLEGPQCNWVLVVGFGEVDSIQLPPVS